MKIRCQRCKENRIEVGFFQFLKKIIKRQHCLCIDCKNIQESKLSADLSSERGNTENNYKLNSNKCKLKECDTPVYGYKGLKYECGVLSAVVGDMVYEQNVTYETEKIDPSKKDLSEVYYHFCLNLEGVFAWRNYVYNTWFNIENNCHSAEYRVFRVKAEGQCIDNNDNNENDWVCNKITILEEVEQKEIIDYYENRLELLEFVIKNIEKDYKVVDGRAVWEKYKRINVEPYKKLLTPKEIIEMCEKSAELNKLKEKCVMGDNFPTCRLCWNYHECLESSCGGAYHYMIERMHIYKKSYDEHDDSYRWLKENKEKKYLASIERLLQE